MHQVLEEGKEVEAGGHNLVRQESRDIYAGLRIHSVTAMRVFTDTREQLSIGLIWSVNHVQLAHPKISGHGSIGYATFNYLSLSSNNVHAIWAALLLVPFTRTSINGMPVT